tara:strand:- start:334 stop:987 length:654 start_codon:yes stop_codon:yes gene_type:complete
MSKTTIPTGGITADAIDATKIADDAISEEHIDATVITASTALAVAPADTDEFLISDAGTIKRIDYSLIKASNAPAFCVIEGGQQTLQHNTYTNLDFGTEIIDSNGAFTSNAFTVPSGQGGKYYLECQINFYDAQGKCSSGMIAIWKGSNSTKLTNLYNVFTGSEASHLSFSVSTLATLAEGDVIGGAATITVSDGNSLTSYGGDGGSRIMGFKLIGV